MVVVTDKSELPTTFGVADGVAEGAADGVTVLSFERDVLSLFLGDVVVTGSAVEAVPLPAEGVAFGVLNAPVLSEFVLSESVLPEAVSSEAVSFDEFCEF